MKQQTYTQKEISIMFNKSLSLLAHYKKELIEKGYMYKNEKGKNIINAEGAEYLRRRFAEIDKLEDYKNQAEDWKKQAEIWKDEKNKEQKDKEVWREIALKKENLLIERQKNSSLSSNEKPNIFKKFNKR